MVKCEPHTMNTTGVSARCRSTNCVCFQSRDEMIHELAEKENTRNTYYTQHKVALQGLCTVYPTPVLALATCGAEFSLLDRSGKKV